MLPKALKSCPKSNKSPDLVTLTHSHSLFHFQKMIHNFLHKKNHFNYDLIGGHRHETILFLRNEFAPGCANLFTYKKCSLPRHLFGFAKGGGVIAQWIHLRIPFAVSGSNPMHTFYSFSIYSQIWVLH